MTDTAKYYEEIVNNTSDIYASPPELHAHRLWKTFNEMWRLEMVMGSECTKSWESSLPKPPPTAVKEYGHFFVGANE